MDLGGGAGSWSGGPVIVMECPRLELHIDTHHLPTGALKVIAAVRPDWPPSLVRFKVFTDGITNKLIGCFLESEPEDLVLVRVYGENTDLLIDRKAETQNFLLLQKAGYAPRLYATFLNGLAYAFVPGEVLTWETVRNPSVYPLVASMMAKLHSIDSGPTVPRKPALWEKTRLFLNLVPSAYSKGQVQKRFRECFPEGIECLKGELLELEDHLCSSKTDVVFCHNDLLLGNIIHNKGQVTFIDYEYAAYNYRAYDIGNHFAEFAGVNDVDYSRYPSKEFQFFWLQVYLKEYKICLNDSEPVELADILNLYVQVNKFSLASHLHWAAWALVQAQHSTIDFDFIGYALTRMSEYYSKKNIFLALHTCS